MTTVFIIPYLFLFVLAYHLFFYQLFLIDCLINFLLRPKMFQHAPVADKHTSQHKQPNKTFRTNQKIKERKIDWCAKPPADPLGRSPRFSVPIPFRLLLNACLLAGKRFLFPSVLFGFSSLVFLPIWQTKTNSCRFPLVVIYYSYKA